MNQSRALHRLADAAASPASKRKNPAELPASWSLNGAGTEKRPNLTASMVTACFVLSSKKSEKKKKSQKRLIRLFGEFFPPARFR
jgi:hypothetical protein